MDPDGMQVIQGNEDEAAEAAAAAVPESPDTALETPEPEAAVRDNTTRHPNHDHDDGSGDGAGGATDPTTTAVAVEYTLTESKTNGPIIATDSTASPAAAGATMAEEKQLLPQQQAPHDEHQSDGGLSPASATTAAASGSAPPAAAQCPTSTPPAAVATAPEGEIPTTNHPVLFSEEIPAFNIAGGASADVGTRAADDAAHLPTRNEEASRPAGRQPGSPSSPASSSSGPKEHGRGRTDEEGGNSSENSKKNQADLDNSHEDDQGIARGGGGADGGAGSGGGEYHPNDLSAKLNRLWGASPPDRMEEVGVMRDMLGYRGELDGILSRLMRTKVGS